MKLRRACKVYLLSLLSIDWSYFFCSANVVVIILGQFTRYLNVILDNGSTELIAEQIQRPALEIEVDLRPTAPIHVNHVRTTTLTKSLPEITLRPEWLCRNIEDEKPHTIARNTSN